MARFGFGGSPGRGMGQRGQRGSGRGLCDGSGAGAGFGPGRGGSVGAGLQNGSGMARGAGSGTGLGRGFRRCRYEEGDVGTALGGNRVFAQNQDRGVIARIESAIEELRRQIAALKNTA